MLSRITVNPQVMLGKPTIRGMRITLEQILLALAGGVSAQELLDEEQVLPIKFSSLALADKLNIIYKRRL